MKTLIIKYIPRALLLVLLYIALACTGGRQVYAKSDGTTSSDMEEKLDSLAAQPKVERLNPGAMCYDTVAQNDTENFICLKCKKATKYPLGTYNQIITLRKQLNAMKGINVKVIDNGFCEHCNNGKPTMKFVLYVYYPDKKKPVRSEIDMSEAEILIQYMEGKRVFKGETGNEIDMKDFLPLLRRVLVGK